MQKQVPPLKMRGRQTQSGPKKWFRIENSWVDEENGNQEVTPVYIYDEIGDSWWGESTSAVDFVQQISTIRTPRIELHLNSPGGDIFDGVAIYNALKAHPAKVTVVIDALAASAASFIAQAGDEVIMTKAATMMIHDGSAMAWGPANVMRETADLLDKLSNTVAGIYADRAGQTTEFWRNLMIEEVWYNASEAVEAGLADRVGDDTKEEDDQAAQNKWDFSVFNYAGRESAPNPFATRQRIANRLKEMTVGDRPQNNEQQPETEVQPPNESQPPVEEEEGTEEAAPETEQVGTPPETPPLPPSPTSQASGVFTFSLQGQPTNDFQAVQNRLNFLEEYRNEAIKSGKVSFVEQLAADNKILATQIEKMTAYALSLNDDQYAAWKDTWDGAANLPLMGSHTGGTTNHSGTQSHEAEALATELETKKGIIRQHKLGGMSEDQIKNTASYKRVMELDPNFKL